MRGERDGARGSNGILVVAVWLLTLNSNSRNTNSNRSNYDDGQPNVSIAKEDRRGKCERGARCLDITGRTVRLA